MFTLPPHRPALMGILNVTPDSFSDGGRYDSTATAIEAGLRMVDEGADLIDVGGESTRPGAESVSVAEELRRTIAVVEGLAARGVVVSIDTSKPEVALQAVLAGASVVNDITGLASPEMVDVCAAAQCIVCIMHMQGEPRTMQENPTYADVVSEVRDSLFQRTAELAKRGIDFGRMWVDPGIGFGKTADHNIKLIANLDEFVAFGFPVLVGVSRKSFIGRIGGRGVVLPVEERLPGTIAAQAMAQQRGARIIRAHDVKESRQTIEIVAAIMASKWPPFSET